MTSIVDQINKYQSFAKSRNVGSDPSSRQVSDASNTAIRSRGNLSSPPAAKMRIANNKGSRKPSREGLMHAPSTVLQLNNTGYDNKRNARYSNRRISVGNAPQQFKSNNIRKPLNTDYRNKGSARGNSVARLTKIMRDK